MFRNFFSVVGGICLVISTGIIPYQSAQAATGRTQNFTITGYYSPLPGQSFYVTGSYEGDIRLNGGGVQGADGTPVFPGMMAAPPGYEYGTKICVPGFGCGAVHDRGQAIVKKGERSLATHDRLDLWMGYGEDGLLRALAWGVQHVACTVYSADANVALGVTFGPATPLGHLLEIPKVETFEENLAFGRKGSAVSQLTAALSEMGFLPAGKSGNYYDAPVQAAVQAFQLRYFVIDDASSVGAGVFGPKTREELQKQLQTHRIEEKIEEMWDAFHFDENMKKGNRSADVWRLQELLIREELLDHVPTGYFGPLTKEALIAFQIRYDIIASEQSNGAGNVGPKTREVLNSLLETQNTAQNTESEAFAALQRQQQKLGFLAGKTLTVGSMALSR